MISFLNKLFKIRTEEWPRTSLLFLITVTCNAGYAWGLIISYAAFLKEQGCGLEALPWIFILTSVCSIIAIAIYTPFVDRIPDHKLHNIIFAVESLGIISGLLLIQTGYAIYAYPFLYLLGSASVAVSSPHHTTYFNSFYNTQAAKRTLPVINAGYRVGGIIAGLSMPLINSWFADPRVLILFWLLSHIAMMLLVWILPRLLKRDKSQNRRSDYKSSAIITNKEKQRSSYFENIREGFQYTTRSVYLRWMALATLTLMILMALLEYESTRLLLKEFDTTTKLADFLALLGAVSNFFIVPVLLFGVSRLIVRLGLGNASLIFPSGSSIICACLVAWPGLVAASAAFIVRTDFRLAFQFPVEGLLYNAVSYRVKGRARAFVSGLLAPVGLLIGGLVLLFMMLVPMAWLIAVLISALSTAYLVNTFVIRKLYSHALIKMLKEEDYSFLLSQQAAELNVTDKTTLRLLEQKLKESSDPQFTIFMAKLISQAGGYDATTILTDAVKAAKDADIRASIVDVMTAAEMSGKMVLQLYTDLLSDPDGNVRQSALAGLEQLAGHTSKAFRELAMKAINDPEIRVFVQALSGLVRSGDFYKIQPAVKVLDSILTSENPGMQALGIRVLGQITDRRALQSLARYLSHPADEVRLQAAIAIENMPDDLISAKEHIQPVSEQMLRLLRDPVERIRQAALAILERIGSPESYQAIISRLTDISPHVRSAAADILAKAGKTVIADIYPGLDSSDSELRKMSAVVLSRINKREFGSLISTHVTDNLFLIFRNHCYLEALSSYNGYSGIIVFQDTLREENQQLLDEIYYLLSAIHGFDAIRIIAESLCSEDAHTRANASEALETLTTSQTAKLIGCLTEPEIKSAYLINLGRENWKMESRSGAEVMNQFLNDTDNSWLRAVIIFVMGEMGASILADSTPSPEPEPRKPKTRRSRQSADLLDSLVSSDSKTAAKSPKRKSHGDSPTRSQAGAWERGNGAWERGKKAFEDRDAETRVDKALMPFKSLEEIDDILYMAVDDPEEEARLAAGAAIRMTAGLEIVEQMTAHIANRMADDSQHGNAIHKEVSMLSTIEIIIFLKKVPFFKSMTIDQLKKLAAVCEEELFEGDTRVFNEGEPGGVLYMVVSGKVGIEQAGRRKGSFVRLATIEPHSYFGEMGLFDNSPRSASAIALQDTLTLRLCREPLIILFRQHPDLPLELINVLSERLREANDQIAGMTRTKPRELHKLFDQFD